MGVDQIKPSDTRDGQIRRVILLEGAANVAALLLKFGVALFTGSVAIMADAMHSLTDVANNFLAWFVARASTQPPDRKHPYGHRKFETLAVFGLATLLTVLAVELVLHALRREPEPIVQTPIGLAVMMLVLAINVGLATWERRWANRLNSPILHADATHTLVDVMTTVAVIIGWQLSAMGYRWLDTVCAIGVAGLVLYLAFGLYTRVVPVLVDEMSVDPDTLARSVQATDGVRDVRRVRSRWQGTARAVDMVITVDPDLPTIDAHEVADAVEQMLEEQYEVEDVSIHIEPHSSR